MKKITAAVLMVVALLAIFFAFMILMDPVFAFLKSSVIDPSLKPIIKPIIKPIVDYGSKPILNFMFEIFPKSILEIPYFGFFVFVLSTLLPVVILIVVFKILIYAVKKIRD